MMDSLTKLLLLSLSTSINIIFLHIWVRVAPEFIVSLARRISLIYIPLERDDEFEDYLESFVDKAADYKSKNLPRLIKKEMGNNNYESTSLNAIISDSSTKYYFFNYIVRIKFIAWVEYLLTLFSLLFVLWLDIFIFDTNLTYFVAALFLFNYRNVWINPMKKLIAYEFLLGFIEEIL